MKILLISASPRDGNTEIILKKIKDKLPGNGELILLRELDIKRCIGCLSCEKTKRCSLVDDMQSLYEKITGADVIIFGTPNYYDNVSGLAKDFIDRTNPLYGTGKLTGKKVISIIVGGGKIENSQRVGQYLKYFVLTHDMVFAGEYYFQALAAGSVKNDKNLEVVINEIVLSLK